MRDGAPGDLAIPAAFWVRPDVRRALATRDMGQLFRLVIELNKISQVRLGAAVGFAQGRISQIVNGSYKVMTVSVFTRIADGLDMPDHARVLLGLAARKAAAPARPADSAGADGQAADRKLMVAGTRYADSTEQAVTAITRLWRADIEQVQALISAPVEPTAWNAAALAWLVSHPDQGLPQPRSGRAVGLADVTRVHESVKLFDQLDGRFGGAKMRRALVQYLRDDAAPMLAGTYTAETGRELYAAVAAAALLAAWANYDSGHHGVAQRYFIQALRLAESSGDRRFAASVLSAMSHQARFLGHRAEAASLACAAQAGITKVATPALAAQFQAMEARALADPADTRACEQVLAATERSFGQAEPGEDPEFIGYFNQAELDAEFAHSFRDLGQPARAAEHATRALAASDGGYPRSDFFVTMVLADAHADNGDPEQACQVALAALRLGESIDSTRCVEYLREFRQRLDRFDGNPAVRDFTEQAAGYAMWAAAQ